MPNYGAWIGVTSIDELQGVGPDHNPSLECDGCETKTGWKDGASEWRGAQDPEAETLLCDDCAADVPRHVDLTPVEYRKEQNASLTEWTDAPE